MENNIEVEVGAVTKDLSKLPKVEAASIHIAGNKGKVSDGVLTASAFVIMVKAGGEWRPENEWLHRAGMKTARRVYTDIENAKAAKAEIKAKWGMPKSEAAQKRDAEKEEAKKVAAQEALKAVRTKMIALGFTDAQIAALGL